jgi:hypothetical protein
VLVVVVVAAIADVVVATNVAVVAADVVACDAAFGDDLIWFEL